ncbi:hypothetical protein niasHS_010418 [Heterodera schachtii]|uniref:F-box domain-containing protein n=1 Tax=Heterodera schachtii TaxID=97005 RepID=A0ABD2IZQ6_HETSC
MAPNCLPPELLFELVPFVPAKCAVPNVFSSCRLLHILLHSRVVKWKEWREKLKMNPIDDQMFNEYFGLKHPVTKQNITVNQAIANGLYQPETRKFINPNTGQEMDAFDSLEFYSAGSINRLVKRGALRVNTKDLAVALEFFFLDAIHGVFRLLEYEMSLPEALKYGYLKIPMEPETFSLTLSDCIEKNWINEQSGQFISRLGEPYTISHALHSDTDWPPPILKRNVREFFDSVTNAWLTITEAVNRGILNAETGIFTDRKSGRQMSLAAAHQRRLIQKPLTLTEAVERNVWSEGGRFQNGGTHHTLLQAINCGILDMDVRHILLGGETLSIREALEKGMLLPDGIIVSENAFGHNLEHMTLRMAYERSILRGRVRYTIFDLRGFKQEENLSLLSFNDAVKAKIVKICKSKSEKESVKFVRGHQMLSLEDAAKQGLVNPRLYKILTDPLGLRIKGTKLVLTSAVASSVLDTSKGVLVGLSNRREMSVRDAYAKGLFEDVGDALHLAALLDVHPSLLTPAMDA